MASGDILSDFGINLLEEEIDDVIYQTNEFLTDATFTGSQGPFWWILQMCMALAALFAIVMAAGMAYKMMVKNEPLDIMKLFKPLAISIILCWWYPGKQREQLVRVGFPILYSELYRLLHS